MWITVLTSDKAIRKFGMIVGWRWFCYFFHSFYNFLCHFLITLCNCRMNLNLLKTVKKNSITLKIFGYIFSFGFHWKRISRFIKQKRFEDYDELTGCGFFFVKIEFKIHEHFICDPIHDGNHSTWFLQEIIISLIDCRFNGHNTFSILVEAMTERIESAPIGLIPVATTEVLTNDSSLTVLAKAIIWKIGYTLIDVSWIEMSYLFIHLLEECSEFFWFFRWHSRFVSGKSIINFICKIKLINRHFLFHNFRTYKL